MRAQNGPPNGPSTGPQGRPRTGPQAGSQTRSQTGRLGRPSPGTGAGPSESAGSAGSRTRPSPSITAHIRVDHYSAVQLAASAARRTALDQGLTGALPDQAAVLASELAGNVAKHAVHGSLYIQPLPLRPGVEILAVDRGPGMADVERCLTDGYTTTRTLGSGLGAVRRIADEFTVRTKEGAGTVVCARLGEPGSSAADSTTPGVGAVRVPADGETACGDSWGLAVTGDVRTALVVDGLGHGAPASEAAELAVRAFHRGADQPLPQLMRSMNRALRRSRGAAVGLLRLTGDGVEHCSVGNVRAVLLAHDGIRHRFGGQPGVVGWNMPEPRVHRIPADSGATALLHSDGIDSRWTHAPTPFLTALPAPLLAGALVHEYRRSRDDATVLTLGPARRDA
ncbi:SpoIIE family protein phosphatase [Streptomyces ficellus]|uniref:SpoIIE family protein phosphatase n=1 Tax=Streptomyces ficellus TaxID=1977088 RepID=A0ABT7Z8F9_9ACTN|nr:ATP-binding protein [Streptomyces ficellus]MDN3295790.1 SpoIIE family protein phosphatase [Streptomyces ficellus]